MALDEKRATVRHKGWVKLTLLLASMMTVMAGATIAPALPEMERAFSGIPNADTAVKLILTIPGLFIALSAPISGWLIDKYGRIWLLISFLVLYALAGTAGLYLQSIPEILASRAVLGVAVGGIMTTAVTLIGDYFLDEERTQFLAIQASVMSYSGTVFITAGGILADISWRHPFLIYGAAMAIVPLAIIFLKEPQKSRPKATAQPGTIPHIAWLVYFISFLGMAIFYVMPVQVPFLIHQISSVGNTLTGIALACTMLVAGSIAILYPKIKKRTTHYQIYSTLFLLMGIGYFTLSYADNYPSVYPGLVIAGLGSGLLVPNSSLCLVTIASPAMRGRILGFLTTAIFLGQFISPIVFQPIVRITSLKGSFLYTALPLVALSAVAMAWSFASKKAQ